MTESKAWPYQAETGTFSQGASRAIEVVGDAWSWMILREAVYGRVTRFEEFRHRLGIARSTLTSRLNQLVEAGLIRMDPSPDRAGGHVYALTEGGHDFFPVLMTALRWGDDWVYPNARPHEFRHTLCGQVTEADLVCRACLEPLRARDVDVSSVEGTRAYSAIHGRRPGRLRTPELSLLERRGASSIARCLQVIGDRWSSLLLRSSFVGIRRFDSFQQDLGIAESILSQRLNRLVDSGVLSRRQYQDRPPRDEYVLTEKGLALYPVYLSILVWGSRWLPADGPSIQLNHRTCSAPVDPLLVCSACSEELRACDLRLVR